MACLARGALMLAAFVAAAALLAAPCARAELPKPVKGAPFDWATLLTNASRVPIIKPPTLAPTVLDILKMEVPANPKPDAPLKLAQLLPKLPQLPAFEAPVFTPATTPAQLQANATLATKALLVPLMESTVLPSYVENLQSRITKEAAWLDTFAKSGAKQGELCGAFGGNARACTVLAYNAQRAKVAAMQSGLDALKSMAVQLDADLAAKLAAFAVPSASAPSGNALCALTAKLAAAAKATASKAVGTPKAAAADAKAAAAVDKISDLAAGRAAGSPHWQLPKGTLLPQAPPCPAVH